MPALIYNVVPRPPVNQAVQWDGSDAAAAAITQLARLAVFGSNPPPSLRPMVVEADWAVSAGVLTVTVTTTLNGQPPSANPIPLNPNDWYISGIGVADDFSFKRDYVASVAGPFGYEGH